MTVVPESSIAVEIIKLAGIGFTRHVCALALIPAILGSYFQSRADAVALIDEVLLGAIACLNLIRYASSATQISGALL